MEAKAILEAAPNQLTKVERHESAVGKALTVAQITERLNLIKQVMAENMTNGTDYGQVPGCGQKPSLFQPGAQKLSMMFQLNPEVLKEEITEFDNYHREYRLTIRVSNGSKFADGIGVCSTLETKYRFRGRDRKGKKLEHDNPSDNWNTVRKMAFKRGFVHAIINATNTSELWSQDLEDLHANGNDPHQNLGRKPSGSGGDSRATRNTSNGRQMDARDGRTSAHEPNTNKTTTPALDQKATPAKQTHYATPESRLKFLNFIAAAPGQQNETLIKTFCVAARGEGGEGMLLETESVVDIPLRFIPISQRQVDLWNAAVSDWQERDAESGEMPAEAHIPFVNEEDPNLDAGGKASGPLSSRSTEAKSSAQAAAPSTDDEWWRDVMVPIPHKGEKQADYILNPDTIGSLYDARHEDDAARKRLFGFAHKFEPKGWNGKPPSKEEIEFREALDAFLEHVQKNPDA